ncbi:MAG TPA: hypothetical protein VGD99_10440, partial [Anaerolineae bacterium]
MKLTYKSTRLTYKTLFGYSMIIITLLVVAVPVFANTGSGSNLLDFSYQAETGNTSQDARTLTPGINLNHLDPGEENWYVYSHDSFSAADLAWISLAMRYESEAIIDTEQANFQVMAQQRSGAWFQPTGPGEEVLGTGLRSPLRGAQPNVVEAFWTGQVAENEVYYVRVFNTSPFGLDYALEAKEEQAVVSGATPASFSSAIGSRESLNARQM